LKKQVEFCPKNPISEKQAPYFEQVNEITWKLTNGEMTNVPTSHRQWAGYRMTKALAWVINIGWVNSSSGCLARHRDQVCGPMSLAEAKAAAKGMMRGMPGEYTVTDPIGHLNGLAARLLDKSGAPSSFSGPVANRDSEMPSLLS
jgi:hypothetical protein